MNALMWKKLNELRKNKIKLLACIILPIIYLFALFVFKVKVDNIIAYYPLNITLISSIICFSIEDMIYTESILATNISIKKMWKSNILFITLIGYTYSTIILVAGILVLNVRININLLSIIQYFGCILGSASLIGFSTIHFCDYSINKRSLASLASIFMVINPLGFFFYGQKTFLSVNELLIFIITSGVLYVISYLIIRNPNKENLIINTQNLIRTYEKSNAIEE